MGNNNNKKKLSTGIEGLDDLFYGGIQLEQNTESSDGLLVLARGEHGVNKIHLAMQMCEGLYISQNETDEVDAFESFNPLSSAINKSFVFDDVSVLKMLVVEAVIEIIKGYVNQKMEKDERWKKFFKKYSEDNTFARNCANRFVEETLNDNKELLKSYWNERWGLDYYRNKGDVEKALEDAVKDYGTSLLRLYVVEETTYDILIKFTSHAKEWVKSHGEENDKRELRKFNKEAAVYHGVFARFIEEELKKKDDLIDQFLKYEEKENVENEVLKSIIEGDERNYSKKLVEVNQEVKGVGKPKRHADEKILFISLNKDGVSLKSKYYDFYMQRLIRNIRSGNKFARSSVELLQRMVWYLDNSCCEKNKPKNGYLIKYGLPSIMGGKPLEIHTQTFTNHIRSSFIYYNGRTHGLHLRHQKGALDTGDMLLCKLFVPEDSLVKIVGRDELNKGNRMADGLTTFNNLLDIIDKYIPKDNGGKILDYIMVDGLSRLTKEEIAQCPFNALSDKLRKACKIGVITADEKIQSSEISTDIVIDMAIKERPNPDQLYHALRISKCLYQRNAYGWHSYKMRMAGIEVIPSIHFQLITRYLMDDIVADALLPIDEDPYPFWLDENGLFSDETIKKGDFYEKYDYTSEKQIRFDTNKSALKGVLHSDKLSAMKMILDELKSKKFNEHIFLFVDLNFNRTEFKHKYYGLIEQINKSNKDNIHLFTFQPGYLHADEFMWALDQQVQALSRTNKKEGSPDTHYELTHLIIGDLNYMSFAYPCLNKEGFVLPAIASYTKKHHMTNFVYASVPSGSNIKMLAKENEIIRQMWAVIGTDNMIEGRKPKTENRRTKRAKTKEF